MSVVLITFFSMDVCNNNYNIIISYIAVETGNTDDKLTKLLELSKPGDT